MPLLLPSIRQGLSSLPKEIISPLRFSLTAQIHPFHLCQLCLGLPRCRLSRLPGHTKQVLCLNSPQAYNLAFPLLSLCLSESALSLCWLLLCPGLICLPGCLFHKHLLQLHMLLPWNFQAWKNLL